MSLWLIDVRETTTTETQRTQRLHREEVNSKLELQDLARGFGSHTKRDPTASSTLAHRAARHQFGHHGR